MEKRNRSILSYERSFLRPESQPRFLLPTDQAVIVHCALRILHRSRRIPVKRIVGPKRAAEEADTIDDDFGILKKVDA